ncbi:MAG TPA: hypothetical protein VKZ60_13645 [Chloroflexota bacterium]|jgi:hypothetical protein|nr:hypothetical protein [Chloroflexota bacterium]
MRFTVIDERTRVSFVAPCPTLEALVAACAQGPRTLEELLDAAAPFAPELRERVLSGLAVFDEHNTPDNLQRIHAAFDYCRPEEVPVFRILDERTREMSLKPVRAGIVLFNLRERRIVQVQNTYAEIQRKGRVRVARPGPNMARVQRYELPAEWSLVPGR